MDNYILNKELENNSYNGFLLGNLFPTIYDPYKGYKPYVLKANNEYQNSLLLLSQYQFAMHELNLYLDIYPNDYESIKEFNIYRNMYKQLLEEYEKKYGPILICDQEKNLWEWNNSPWPWEGMMN